MSGMGRPALFGRVLPLKTLNRDLKLIFVSNFLGAFGDGLFIFILPVYIRYELAATSADVGLLYSILILSSALTIVPGGFMADRFDRKKIMVLGWLIWVPIPLMFSVATHWSQLVPAMALYGVLLSAPASSAYVVTSADKEALTLTFTMLGAAWWLGYIFSPALGGYLSTMIGMQWLFSLSFVIYFFATGVLLFIRSQHPSKSRFHSSAEASQNLQPFRGRRILLLALFFSASLFLLSLVRPLIPQFLKDQFRLSRLHIGLLGSINFLGSVAFSIGLGKMGDKQGKMVATSASLLIGGASLALIIAFNNLPLLLFAFFLNGASLVIWSLMGSAVGSITPEASRGRWISVAQLMTRAVAFTAPYLGGILYEVSPYMPFHIVIICTPFLALLALASTKRTNLEYL